MLISETRKLLLKCLPFLLGFVLSYLPGITQTYNPSVCCTVSNKAYGAAQAVTTDGRSWFYDATNVVPRDYNGTTEVLSYLNLAKYRSGHFPIYVHSGGILQGNGVWLGGSTLVYWFKDSTGNANLVRWYTDSTGVSGGPFYAVANNLSEGNAGLIKGNLVLDLVDNTSDAQKNAAAVALTNHTIDGNSNTLLNIANSSLAHSTIGLTLNNTGATPQVTTTPAALGASLVLAVPWANGSDSGFLRGTDWSFFNGKLDSVRISNDSVYNCVNGTCTLQSVIAGTGGVNSVDGTNGSLLFSPTTGNVLGQVNPAFTFNWSGQHSFLSFAPIFSTLTTAGGVFYGDAFGQLLESGSGTAGQILESSGGSAPTFFTPNASTVNGWLGYTALSNALGSTKLFVGNGSNIATGVNVSQDASVSNTGVWTNTGLKANAIPSLSTGNLRWNGSAWVFDNTAPSGSGVAGEATFWTGTSTISGDASFTWNNSIKLLYADSMNNQMMVQRVDTTMGILQVYPCVQGPAFYMSLDQTFTNPDGNKDNVYGYDLFNMIGDGSRVDSHFPGFGRFTESHFQASGSKQMEDHVVFVDSNGQSRRLYSMLINELSGHALAYWTVSQMDWNPTDINNPRAYFSIREDGTFGSLGLLPKLSLTDTVSTHGQFSVETEVDGSVRIQDQTGGSNSVFDIRNNLVITPSLTNTDVVEINLGSTSGIGAINVNGTTTGYQLGLNGSVSADQGFVSVLLNTSTAAGAFSAINLTAQGGGGNANSAPLIVYRIPGLATTDFTMGTNPVTQNWEIHHNTSGLMVGGLQFSLTNAGGVMLNNYGAGTFTGTATRNLSVDATGNVIETSTQVAHTIFTPTTGGTVNLVNNQRNIINPAGALLALTVNLPSTPANNDVVYIKFTQTVTTVTYGNGTVVDGINPIAGSLVVLTYDSGTTSWY